MSLRVLYIGLFISLLYAKEGYVAVQCPHVGYNIYVDGKKVGIVTKKPLGIPLREGSHEIMVSHILDEEWQEVARKKVMVEANTSKALSFSLKLEKLSQKRNTNSKDDFKKHRDTVIYKKGKLVWQDDISVIKVQKNWSDAQAYCKSLPMDHGIQWRLPTYDELISIVDYTKHSLAIMPAFEHIVSESYWTSNTDVSNPQNAKNVYFGNGCPNSNAKEDLYYVRCVHSVP